MNKRCKLSKTGSDAEKICIPILRLNVSAIFFLLSPAIVNYFLPDVSKCTWDYLIAVCDGTRKKHILRDNLCGKRVPGYQELKIKNCFHDITG